MLYKESPPKMNLRGSQSGGYLFVLCSARSPRCGNTSGAKLGVPFKALLHRHNACRPALQRGESSVAGTKKESPKGLSQSGGYLLSHNAVQYHRRCCLSLLPSPLRASLRLSRPPRAAGAHTAARPAPLMHFSQPNDHPSLMTT